MSSEHWVEREIRAAYVIVKARLDGVDKYLLQWNEYWKAYSFVGGKFEQSKDFDLPDAAARELTEELSAGEVLLREGSDFEVREAMPGLIEWKDFSDRHKKWTRYQAKIFVAIFLKSSEQILCIIESNNKNKWFKEEEIIIRAGDTQVSRTVVDVVSRIPGGLLSLPYSL